MPELRSAHIVEHGHQRRFVNIPQALGCTLRQHKPIMPVAESVLGALELRNELVDFRRLYGELGRIARPFPGNAVLMEHVVRRWALGRATRVIICCATTRGSRSVSELKSFAARLRRLRTSRVVSFVRALRNFFSCSARSSIKLWSSSVLRRGSCGIFKLRSADSCTSRSRTLPARLRIRFSRLNSFLSLRVRFGASSSTSVCTRRVPVRKPWTLSGFSLEESFNSSRSSFWNTSRLRSGAIDIPSFGSADENTG